MKIFIYGLLLAFTTQFAYTQELTSFGDDLEITTSGERKVKDKDLNIVLQNKETLEILNFGNARRAYDDEGFYLYFYFDHESGYALIAETAFPVLRELNLSIPAWTNTGNSALDFIVLQNNLETLFLDGWRFDDKDLRYLTALPKLNTLSFSMAHFSSDNIEQLTYSSFPSLEKIIARQATIKAAPWDLFAPNLKTLDLAESEINGADVNAISKLMFLEKLDMSRTEIPSGNIKKLGSLPFLVELSLAETNMQKADFSSLQSLEVLDLSNTFLSITAFQSLQHLHNLKELNLYGQPNSNITSAMIQELKLKLPDCDIKF